MEKPDRYGDWVLFPAKDEETKSAVPPDDQLISAAREAWPHVVAHAQKEFHQRSLGPDSTSLAAQIWEGVLRSVSRARQRDRDHRPPIANLESYLIGAFHRRFNKALLREERRLETIELVSSSVDLERIEGAQDASWVEEHPQSAQDQRWKRDRKSTRLNSSHTVISYAVFCLKKKETAEAINRLEEHGGLLQPLLRPVAGQTGS